MKRTSRRLLPFLLFVAFLFASNVLASRTTNVTTSPGQDCPTSCAQKRDMMLQRCDRLPAGDRKTTCQNSANSQYDTCVQNCSAGKSGGSKGNP